MTDDISLSDLPQPTADTTTPPDALTVDGDNPNEMTDEQFGLLCDRMRENGWLGGPVITDTDGLIADGEHRWRAAQEIGLAEVPVRQYDIDDATRRLWRQELNKIHGEHDRKRDALEYDFLLDNGFSEEVTALTEAADEDLDELLAEIRMDGSRPAAYEYDPEHNVYFEDCVEGMRERLAEDSVDCIITDPPYGVEVDVTQSQGQTKKSQYGEGTVKNDSLDQALALFTDSLKEIQRTLTDDGLLYIFASWKTYPEFIEVIKRHGYRVLNCLVWVKSDTTPYSGYQGRYQYQHEFIIVAGGEDARRISGNHSDVMEYTEARFEDVADQKTVHPTQKPVALLSDLMDHATEPGDTVLDPFMGSGTTAVAAIQNDRNYIGFEIDEENYRGVIERRIGEAKRQREASVNQEVEADD